ncbi:DUF5994 family protein [Crossiella sp. CA198]|uniref:DUF5994 family protein n=1 Tax=Crossiella sp. CA198 TaxID=3455607 RepID=UPI003F8D8EB8
MTDMTSGSTQRQDFQPPAAGAVQHEPRVQLKPVDASPGFLDGGWWPNTMDLGRALPALLSALRERLGPVSRVTYHLEHWLPAPRRLTVGGRTVRLEGYRSPDPRTITVTGQSGQRIVLLVVPPETAEPEARRVLELTAGPDNRDSAASLLGVIGPADQD